MLDTSRASRAVGGPDRLRQGYGGPPKRLAKAERPALRGSLIVNDIHSQLNATRVAAVAKPRSIDELQALVRAARDRRQRVSVAGGRHAMGGQQFGDATLHLDMTGMARVLALDPGSGTVTVEAGITWPDLIDWLVATQSGRLMQWGIVQKQTGADRLTIGGALAANIHGRGLTLRPFAQDVESFLIVDSDGIVHACSRTANPELFRLAVGGYGLFGIVAHVTLRLRPRRKVERRVALATTDQLMAAFDRRIAEGFEFGDFQFAIDPATPEFMRAGVLSCYRPVADSVEIPGGQRVLRSADWRELLRLAHDEKQRAFEVYAQHYMATDGQIYWSDTHQLAEYLDDYHAALDRERGSPHRASEMISEVYVPRSAFESFVADVRDDFRRDRVDLVYGTVRLIERDEETFLAWATEPWACTVVNIHTEHTRGGIARSAKALRRLIDRAWRYGGRYYLTYHRWARRDQIEGCYPQFPEFLRLKRTYDPGGRFESEWYRHYKAMFS
jgi:FAD/FMN-containing dehydrogenase